MQKSREITLQLQGKSMAAVEYNPLAKKTAIALHGWLDNAASFELLASLLPDYRIIALDFMGHGKSDHRSEQRPYYLWDNVIDLHLAIEYLSLQNVTIIGHSMGASIAMLYGACFAENVNQLCLIEGLAPLYYREFSLAQQMAKAIKRHVKPVTKAQRCFPDLQHLIDARANSRFPLSQDAARRLVERGATITTQGVHWRSDSRLLNPSINRFSKPQVMQFLQSLTMPVHLVLGRDGLVTDEWREYFAQIKQLELITMGGNHHLHMYERSAAQIAVIYNALLSKGQEGIVNTSRVIA